MIQEAANNYELRFRMWITGNNAHFLGNGRVRLLENIRDKGSITNAAKAMKMSYRQAWQMVEDMNRSAPAALVEKTLGGKGGGGAHITPAGEKAIRLFYTLEKKIEQFARELNNEINL